MYICIYILWINKNKILLTQLFSNRNNKKKDSSTVVGINISPYIISKEGLFLTFLFLLKLYTFVFFIYIIIIICMWNFLLWTTIITTWKQKSPQVIIQNIFTNDNDKKNKMLLIVTHVSVFDNNIIIPAPCPF